MIVHIDFENAYDYVSWKFLYYMMARMGFCEKWVHWIKECLESSSISILFNRSPSKEFKPTSGLKQRDPIAPFLFLIVAQGLLGLVNQAARKDLFSKLKVDTKKDDTLIMCGPNIQNVRVVKAMLRCFKICSDLIIIFLRAKLVPLEWR